MLLVMVYVYVQTYQTVCLICVVFLYITCISIKLLNNKLHMWLTLLKRENNIRNEIEIITTPFAAIKIGIV